MGAKLIHSSQLKVGLIGAGEVGNLRAQTLRSSDNAILVGVADVDEASAKAVARDSRVPVFSDYRELLSATNLDAVFVASPINLHEEMVVAALQAGKHVLCEKPLANGSEACARILRCAEEAGTFLAVGFNHRYFPSFKFMKDVIDSGQLGKIDHVRAMGAHNEFMGLSEWMYQGSLLGGGAMMDIGIHLLDLLRHLVADISDVYGITSNRIWNVEGAEDNALVLMRSKQGIPISYQAAWTNWPGYQFWIEVYGEKGMVRGQCGPMTNTLVMRIPDSGKVRRTHKKYRKVALSEKVLGWHTTARGAFSEELEDFVSAVAGRDHGRLANGLDGAKAVELCAAVYESNRTRARVSVS